MSDRHAAVTPNVTRDSQHPVPSRPYPTRPALYIDRGDFTSWRLVSDASGEPEPTGTTAHPEPVDAMMDSPLDALDFRPTCSTPACQPNPNPAAYAVRWVTSKQPALGHGVWLMCDPCWQAGTRIQASCPSGILWRVVEVLR